MLHRKWTLNSMYRWYNYYYDSLWINITIYQIFSNRALYRWYKLTLRIFIIRLDIKDTNRLSEFIIKSMKLWNNMANRKHSCDKLNVISGKVIDIDVHDDIDIAWYRLTCYDKTHKTNIFFFKFIAYFMIYLLFHTKPLFIISPI